MHETVYIANAAQRCLLFRYHERAHMSNTIELCLDALWEKLPHISAIHLITNWPKRF